MPWRRRVLVWAVRAVRASRVMAAAGSANADTSGWNWTGAPVPPVLIQFGWALTLPLTVAVAVLPVLAAALTIARRPDAAAELRTAEAA